MKILLKDYQVRLIPFAVLKSFDNEINFQQEENQDEEKRPSEDKPELNFGKVKDVSEINIQNIEPRLPEYQKNKFGEETQQKNIFAGLLKQTLSERQYKQLEKAKMDSTQDYSKMTVFEILAGNFFF